MKRANAKNRQAMELRIRSGGGWPRAAVWLAIFSSILLSLATPVRADDVPPLFVPAVGDFPYAAGHPRVTRLGMRNLVTFKTYGETVLARKYWGVFTHADGRPSGLPFPLMTVLGLGSESYDVMETERGFSVARDALGRMVHIDHFDHDGKEVGEWTVPLSLDDVQLVPFGGMTVVAGRPSNGSTLSASFLNELGQEVRRAEIPFAGSGRLLTVGARLLYVSYGAGVQVRWISSSGEVVETRGLRDTTTPVRVAAYGDKVAILAFDTRSGTISATTFENSEWATHDIEVPPHARFIDADVRWRDGEVLDIALLTSASSDRTAPGTLTRLRHELRTRETVSSYGCEVASGVAVRFPAIGEFLIVQDGSQIDSIASGCERFRLSRGYARQDLNVFLSTPAGFLAGWSESRGLQRQLVLQLLDHDAVPINTPAVLPSISASGVRAVRTREGFSVFWFESDKGIVGMRLRASGQLLQSEPFLVKRDAFNFDVATDGTDILMVWKTPSGEFIEGSVINAQNQVSAPRQLTFHPISRSVERYDQKPIVRWAGKYVLAWNILRGPYCSMPQCHYDRFVAWKEIERDGTPSTIGHHELQETGLLHDLEIGEAGDLMIASSAGSRVNGTIVNRFRNSEVSVTVADLFAAGSDPPFDASVTWSGTNWVFAWTFVPFPHLTATFGVREIDRGGILLPTLRGFGDAYMRDVSVASLIGRSFVLRSEARDAGEGSGILRVRGDFLDELPPVVSHSAPPTNVRASRSAFGQSYRIDVAWEAADEPVDGYLIEVFSAGNQKLSATWVSSDTRSTSSLIYSVYSGPENVRVRSWNASGMSEPANARGPIPPARRRGR